MLRSSLSRSGSPAELPSPRAHSAKPTDPFPTAKYAAAASVLLDALEVTNRNVPADGVFERLLEVGSIVNSFGQSFLPFLSAISVISRVCK
jgi:hypothetical protein